MNGMRYKWDPLKNELNIRKHGVSFEEAQSVFNDTNVLIDYDVRHSADEERFVAAGMSRALRVLVVCHCYRESDTVIRIISARKAARKELDEYGRRNERFL